MQSYTSPLLLLPAEVRHIILGLVFEDLHVYLDRGERRIKESSSHEASARPSIFSILYCCKQLCGEALSVFFSTTIFHLEELAGRKPPTVSPPATLYKICKLSVWRTFPRGRFSGSYIDSQGFAHWAEDWQPRKFWDEVTTKCSSLRELTFTNWKVWSELESQSDSPALQEKKARESRKNLEFTKIAYHNDRSVKVTIEVLDYVKLKDPKIFTSASGIEVRFTLYPGNHAVLEKGASKYKKRARQEYVDAVGIVLSKLGIDFEDVTLEG